MSESSWEPKIVRDVREALAEQPQLLPLVLKAAAEGAAAFERRARAANDGALDLAIMASLSLPVLEGKMSWSLQNSSHRARARVLAKGLRLSERASTRSGLSGYEALILDFVRQADALDPKDALGHYEILYREGDIPICILDRLAETS